jgi:hypothetical protein
VRACARCLQSHDPAKCLECAGKPAFQPGMLDSALNAGLTKADGCASCYNASRPLVCLACLATNVPCGECALQQPDSSLTVDVSACVNCTMKHGDKFKTACMACSGLGKHPDQVDKCLRCLDTMRPLLCKGSEDDTNCWNAEFESGACVAYASWAEDFDICMACMQKSPYSGACQLCSQLNSCKQAQCYQCVNAASHPGNGCYECLKYVEQPAQQQQCLACMANPTIGEKGKDWCYGCINWCNSYESRAKCIQCLGTPQENYWSSCQCSN